MRQNTWSYGTVSALLNGRQIQVTPDGQGNLVYAVAQYASPAVGDRVTLNTIGRQIYATGKIN